MNEEEIRGKLLLPFLNDLGFDVSEISLEMKASPKTVAFKNRNGCYI
jgi:hypothetical protein